MLSLSRCALDSAQDSLVLVPRLRVCCPRSLLGSSNIVKLIPAALPIAHQSQPQTRPLLDHEESCGIWLGLQMCPVPLYTLFMNWNVLVSTALNWVALPCSVAVLITRLGFWCVFLRSDRCCLLGSHRTSIVGMPNCHRLSRRTLHISVPNTLAHKFLSCRPLACVLPQAFEILDASVEAGLTLREVEDVVFSNTRTLQFFNDVDLKQVQWCLCCCFTTRRII